MKSYKKIVALAALSAACMVASAAAYADDEPKNFSVTVGLKAWATEWQTWGGFDSAKKIAANPSVTVKYKKFFVSGSFLPNTNYNIHGGTTYYKASRSEWDLSAGYYIHPQVAITIGYKESKQDWTASGFGTYKWKIPAIGVSAAAAIQDTRMFMYGNAAFGSASITWNGQSVAGMSGGLYTTSELGVGYSITPSARVSVGYKYQIIPTTWTQTTAGVTTSFTQFDSTRGLVLGGSYTF